MFYVASATIWFGGMDTEPRTLKILETFEMLVYRRTLEISWMGRVTNLEELYRIGKEQENNYLQSRKENWSIFGIFLVLPDLNCCSSLCKLSVKGMWGSV